jgi:hypothetical protein
MLLTQVGLVLTLVGTISLALSLSTYQKTGRSTMHPFRFKFGLGSIALGTFLQLVGTFL